MQVVLPIRRHPSRRPGNRPVGGVVLWREEVRALVHLLVAVVVEPVFARLEARDQRVRAGEGVSRCMLSGRGVATADMAALGASAKMKPPAALPLALLAAWTAGWNGDIDTRRLRHSAQLR
jgi:hypothetical protein